MPKNVTTVQFLIWAYGVSYATFKRWKNEDFKWTKKVAQHAGKSVLTDLAFAKTIYTPKRMFINAKMAEWYESQRVQSRRVDPQAKRNKRACLKTAWTRLPYAEKASYEKLSRDHHAKQPFMKECLVDALQKKMGGNCLRSYRSLEKATDGWCSHTTIETWLKSQPTFATYSKKVRPGLTEANRDKQVQFAKHVFSDWGLPRTQKILWTMSDEKWWYGLVLRTFAKMCPALGIDKEVFACHHKKHIGTNSAHALFSTTMSSTLNNLTFTQLNM